MYITTSADARCCFWSDGAVSCHFGRTLQPPGTVCCRVLSFRIVCAAEAQGDCEASLYTLVPRTYHLQRRWLPRPHPPTPDTMLNAATLCTDAQQKHHTSAGLSLVDVVLCYLKDIRPCVFVAMYDSTRWIAFRVPCRYDNTFGRLLWLDMLVSTTVPRGDSFTACPRPEHPSGSTHTRRTEPRAPERASSPWRSSRSLRWAPPTRRRCCCGMLWCAYRRCFGGEDCCATVQQGSSKQAV